MTNFLVISNQTFTNLPATNGVVMTHITSYTIGPLFFPILGLFLALILICILPKLRGNNSR